MADEQEVQSQVTEVPAAGGQEETPAKTFTQADVERIIAERLQRERQKYQDYPELKRMAEEYQKLREAQMTEQEKLAKRLSELERAVLEKEQEVAALRLESLKAAILDEYGLPRAWAVRILGTTEEEIRQDVLELRKLLGTDRTVGAPTNPAQSGILTPDALATMTMEQYAQARRRLG